MLAWLRKRLRKWRRGRAYRHGAPRVPAAAGTIAVALCHPLGACRSPAITTVFRQGKAYRGMADVEIRGFLDGACKFERNVATQYHVRVGCEGSSPVKGAFEVMRVLQRWDLSALPRGAAIRDVRLILRQEDTSGFPRAYPPRWPVEFYLYETRKPWGAGRGGTQKDNQSKPERGDAWWLEARAGEMAWTQSGCGFGSDHDARADRGSSPLAWARLSSSRQDLCFSGPCLAAHVERILAEGKTLDVLVKSSDVDEASPGSGKAFFSAEFGDDLSPLLRPRLEVDWTAPAAWVETRPFVLEPGSSTRLSLWVPPEFSAEGIVAAGVFPAPGAAGGLLPEVSLEARREEGAAPLDAPRRLDVPAGGLTAGAARVRLSAAPNPVAAGEEVSIEILETWTPSAPAPEALQVSFEFLAPSGRRSTREGRYLGDFTHGCRFRPDEPGVWSYSWRCRPDARFLEHRGEGFFSVVRAAPGEQLAALEAFAAAAIEGARAGLDPASRQQARFRLTAMQAEIASCRAAGALPDGAGGKLEDLLAKLAAALPVVE